MYVTAMPFHFTSKICIIELYAQTCSEGYTFSATALYRGVSLFLGSIN